MLRAYLRDGDVLNPWLRYRPNVALYNVAYIHGPMDGLSVKVQTCMLEV